jgi:hypothetical protein
MKGLLRIYRQLLIIVLFVAAADMLSRDAILPVIAPQVPTPDVPLPRVRPPDYILEHWVTPPRQQQPPPAMRAWVPPGHPLY